MQLIDYTSDIDDEVSAWEDEREPTTMMNQGILRRAYEQHKSGMMDRNDYIAFFEWNDRNGIYSDADCDAEDMPRLTIEECRQMMDAIEIN